MFFAFVCTFWLIGFIFALIFKWDDLYRDSYQGEDVTEWWVTLALCVLWFISIAALFYFWINRRKKGDRILKVVPR